MAKTQSQIQAEKKKLVEDFASTQKSLDEIHERQMEDLPEDYEEKLKSAVDAANESFEKYQAAEKDQGENAGDKLSEERKQEYLTGKAAINEEVAKLNEAIAETEASAETQATVETVTLENTSYGKDVSLILSGVLLGALVSFAVYKFSRRNKDMDKKKSWVMRPVAWICTYLGPAENFV